MKLGSLCTGYGGLDMAAEAYFDAETVWVSEFDKYASKVIEERINKPNLGDLKVIDWHNVESIDILTAGYPCQPFSHAGLRKGVEDERHLWPYIKTAISILRPRFVFLENVRGHFGLGFREVLTDLTSIGYDTRWTLIRASDVGAPHRRERLFILAYSNGTRWEGSPGSQRSDGLKQGGEVTANTSESRLSCSNTSDLQSGESGACGSCDTPTNSDCIRCHDAQRGIADLQRQTGQEFNRPDRHEYRRGTAVIPNTNNCGGFGSMQGSSKRYDPRRQMHLQAVPAPLDSDRLNPKFVEYMMGLPDGWVTDIDISYIQKLKILGNGVVPQQAYRALEILNSYPQ